MANSWLRLWHDMPNDPKWRTISRASKQSITAVISIYVHLLVIASNASERGRTIGTCSEDLASALDLEIEQVEAVLQAMQGRVLDGDMVSGWSKRQVDREDGSADRAKRWRDARKEGLRTQANASERMRTTDKDKDKDKDKDTEADQSQKHSAPPAYEVQARPEKRAAVAASSFDAIGFLIDSGVEQQTAADYLTLRKSKKAPATKTALLAIVREIGIARMTPQAGVEMCCSRGWVGFKADWLTSQPARAGPVTPINGRQARIDSYWQQVRARDENGKFGGSERDITGESERVA